MALREVIAKCERGQGRIYRTHINERSRRKKQISSRREIERGGGGGHD
jgi:hypothetical protein